MTYNILLKLSTSYGTQYQYAEILCKDMTYKDVWHDVKRLVGTVSSLSELSNALIQRTNYFKKSGDNDNYQYIVEITYEPTVIDCQVYHSDYYDKRIICFCDRYIYDNSNEGNCIDDFIKRGVESRLAIIDTLVKSIKERMPQRQVANIYHNTCCYEKDFAQICLLKNQAQKIVDNCNKQLERISEKYTK